MKYLNNTIKSNLPNIISICRIALSLVFIVLMSINKYSFIFYANLVFIVASATDFLDGYYARKFNVITNFGKIIDPLADKILVCSAYVYLASYGIIYTWISVIIITREFAITSLRVCAVDNNIIIPANNYGKIKTILQIIFAGIFIDQCSYTNHKLSLGNFLPENVILGIYSLSHILFYFVVIYTVMTIIVYVVDFNKMLSAKNSSLK